MCENKSSLPDRSQDSQKATLDPPDIHKKT